MFDMLRLNEVLAIAQKHSINSNDSSIFCYDEATDRVNENTPQLAARWALRSLAYSVGILHEDYIKVAIDYDDLL